MAGDGHLPGLESDFFEDPHIRTEVRLIYLYNRVSDDLALELPGVTVPLGGADIHAFGAQIRVALTPRLALIATNNVGIVFRPDHPIPGTAFRNATGYSDLDVGFNYALIDDRAHQFLFTPYPDLCHSDRRPRSFSGR